jgi:hypothetical protein
MSRNLRGDLARVAERLRHRRPPDPLPTWWGREPATLTDGELADAIAWYQAGTPPHLRWPDPASMSDDELANEMRRLGVGRRGRR